MEKLTRLVSDRSSLFKARNRRRVLVTAAVGAAVLLVAAGTAFACIPWAGSLQVEALDDNENVVDSTTVYGADHTDVAKDGTQNADRGNNQGMVWCSTQDANVPQPYPWVEINADAEDPDANDVTLTVGDNADDVAGGGSGCDSDVYLPEDTYHITFHNSVFDNEDESTNASGDPTYSDDRDTTGQTPDTNGPDELYTTDHCMDTDDDETDGTDDNQIPWDLTEDESPTDPDTNDGTDPVDDERFPGDVGTDGDGDGWDVIDEQTYSKSIDLEDFNPAPDHSTSGVNNRNAATTGVEAGCLGITTANEFLHDNTGPDNDDDTDLEGGEKDSVSVEYGNIVPVNWTTM